MQKLNANQIALVIFIGWYVMEDTMLNKAHLDKLCRIVSDILNDNLEDWNGDITEVVFDEYDVPTLYGLPNKQNWAIRNSYTRIVTDRVKEGNLPDDLERLMIRLTTMDLKLITEETILSTVKAWNYGN